MNLYIKNFGIQTKQIQFTILITDFLGGLKTLLLHP